MDVVLTKQAIQKILIGVLIVAFGDIIIDAIFAPDSTDYAQSFVSNDFTGTTTQWVVSTLLTAAAVVVGYVMYLGGLTKLATQVDAIGMDGAKQVRTAIILMIVGAAVSIIPVIGGIACGVLSIIGWALMVKGFGKLKKSDSFTAPGIQAISLLVGASILGLIGEAIDFVPLTGWLVWCLMAVSLGLQIAGWFKLNSSIQQ